MKLYRVTNNRTYHPDDERPWHPVFSDGQWCSVAAGETRELYLDDPVWTDLSDDEGIEVEPL
jgi:hypothetical protein